MTNPNETQAALQLKQALHNDARTHIGRMIMPVFQPERRIAVIPTAIAVIPTIPIRKD